MDKKEILRLGKDLRFISGIYNYCDRWCERCPFTSRCLTYAMTEKIEGDLSGKDTDNRIFWEEIQTLFEQTYEMIIEMAEDRGIDLDSKDTYAESVELGNQFKEAERHHLSQRALEYIQKVNELFDEEGTPFSPKPDAVEVIRWYQYLILAKIVRAVSHDELSYSGQTDDEAQKDADGSIKVVLIGIDRSIGAWGMLRESFPDKKEGITDVLLLLDNLRRKIEQEFPSARAFIGPGFDTLN